MSDEPVHIGHSQLSGNRRVYLPRTVVEALEAEEGDIIGFNKEGDRIIVVKMKLVEV